MFRPPETFHTARLHARPTRPEDAPAAFAAYASDPDVTRYLAWPPYQATEPLAEFFRARAADWDGEGKHFTWLIRLQKTDEVVGTIGCLSEGGKVLFGYALGKKFWGQGLAAEALRYLVDWSLKQPGIYRAWAFCDIENPASGRVMEKAGMTREGILRRWHACPNLGSELRDCFVYARVN